MSSSVSPSDLFSSAFSKVHSPLYYLAPVPLIFLGVSMSTYLQAISLGLPIKQKLSKSHRREPTAGCWIKAEEPRTMENWALCFWILAWTWELVLKSSLSHMRSNVTLCLRLLSPHASWAWLSRHPVPLPSCEGFKVKIRCKLLPFKPEIWGFSSSILLIP